MSEIIDDNALLGDDDELDYDLPKDEEDALLADPENFDENYDDVDGAEADLDAEVEANEEDILDIDSNVRLDEEDVADQTVTESAQTLQDEDEEDFEEQKQRNRFNSERNDNQAIHRLTSNEIPDTLEKVAVQPFNSTNNNYQRNNSNNGRFHRGRGRGNRGRGFNNHAQNTRPSVFGRVGNGNFPTPMENKKVLINPHFRGNVQVNEHARLVWDQNSTGINQQHPRFPNNPVIPVAPFQAQVQPQPQQHQPQHQQPSPWVVPPYNEPNTGFNYPDYQNPNQNQNQDLRPLMSMNHQPMTNWSEDATYNSEPIYQNQGHFRGREVRFNQPHPHHQVLINQPQRNFIQVTQQPQQQQQRPPLLNQPNIPPLLPLPQQPPQQPYIDNQFMNQQFTPQQNQFHQFPQQQQQPPPPQQHQQVFNQSYDYNNYGNNYYPKPPHGNFQGAPVQPVQNFNQQHQFQTGHYETSPNNNNSNTSNNININNTSRQFNRSVNIRDQRPAPNINRGGFNQATNRTPPKRRPPFEQKNIHLNVTHNQGNQNDLPKKKRRSMELANLHEVPTVDMPDTTTEDKGEDEDEETKAYRKKIEEQKKLREKIIQQKEERRKLAAAIKQQSLTLSQPLLQTPQLQAQPQKQQQQQQQLKKNKLIIQRRVNDPQPQQQPQQQQPQRIVMMKQPLQQQQQSTNRRVILKGLNNKEASTTGFLSNRKVIAATTTTTTTAAVTSGGVGVNVDKNINLNFNENLIETPVVVVSNLAASTTDVKIRSMCQGLGPIQTIEMIPNSRQATITFKNIVSAHKFFKKFQRKIVDLSMIQVTLEALT